MVLNATGSTAAYGYSCTRGAFVGVSVESLLLCVREQVGRGLGWGGVCTTDGCRA